MKYITISYVILLFVAVFGDDSPQVHYDTIVIGAGAAGVMAASTLARAGRHVLLLEAQDRVGGRVYTTPFGDGVVELGAEWLHGTVNHPGYDLAVQNNITILDQPDTITAYTSDGSPVDQELVKELINYCLYSIEERPEKPMPLGEFITKQLTDYLKKHKPELVDQKNFMYMILKHIRLQFAVLSAWEDWNQITTWSDYEQLEGNLDSSWGRTGYNTFFEMMLNTYKGGPGLPNLEIKLSSPVKLIQRSREADPVTVIAVNGARYSADNVIITVSLGVLKNKYTELFSPELPIEKINAIRNISMGCVNKILLSFDEEWWPREFEEFEFLWKEEDSKELNDDWTTKVYCASPPMGADNVLTLWLSGETAKMVESLEDDEIKSKSMGLLRRFMGRNTTVPEPTGLLRSKWCTNQYTRGSYSYNRLNMDLYPTARDDLAAPLIDDAGNPKVMFAGEATEKKHYSTVHGAAYSGKREAQRILEQIKV